MANDNSDILALLGDILRATDRQTEQNTKAIGELHAEMRETRQEWTGIFNQFATAIADGFNRVEGKIDGLKQEVTGVKQEVADLRQDVQRIDQRLERVEKALPGYEDVIRRLVILENIVLNKAS
jgi:archaellum component FlaC